MSGIATLFLFALGVVFCGPIWAGEPAVKVSEVAAVPRADIRLKDIAEPLPGMSGREWSAMSGKRLMAAPASRGRRVRLGREQLRQLLGRAFGREVESFLLPDQLIVQRGGRVLSRQKLRQRVLSFLRRKTEGMAGDVEFRDLKLPEYIFLRSRDSDIDFRATTPVKPGRNSLWIRAVGPRGELERRFSGNVFIDLWRAVPCAGRPLNRHEPLSPEAVTFERKNLAYLSYTVWDGQGGPWRMTRSVGTGQVLYARNLEPVPLISRGDQVTLCFKSEFIRLRVPALAMEDAGYGESLRVRNLQSRKTVYATVKSKNTVLVE